MTAAIFSASPLPKIWYASVDGVGYRYSDDDGVTWNTTATSLTLNASYAVYGTRRGVVLLSTFSSPLAKVYRSTDRGITFNTTPINVLSGGVIRSLISYGSRWVAVGNSGKISYSTNDGLTWTAATSGVTDDLYTVTTDGTNWLVGGVQGKILRSTDNGVTWSSISNSHGTGEIACISTDGTTFVAVGGAGGVSRSTDGGATWSSLIDISSTDNLFSVCNVDGVFILSSTQWIKRSTDSGASWGSEINVTSSASAKVYNLSADKDGTVMAFAPNSDGGAVDRIHVSADKGATWNSGVSIGTGASGNFGRGLSNNAEAT